MHKLDLVADPKEEAARLRRQRNEEERKKRIFDPRWRQIGIDVEGLNRQIQEKNEIEDLEKRRENAFDRDMLKADEIACLLDHRLELDKRELENKINKFREEYQKPNTRREFDLYDPDGLKKELPARVSDDDPRCSLSGMQKFKGEDLTHKQRKSLQQKQLRHWLIEQKQLRSEAEENQKLADEIYKSKLVELDQRACELQQAEQACRRAMQMAIKNYNTAYARQQQREKELEKRIELEDNFTEMANTIYGDLLMEKPGDRSALGPHRVSKQNYRGMSEEDKAEIRRIQIQQIKEKEEMEAKERREKQNWDDYALNSDESALRLEMELSRRKKEELRNLLDENKKLASQQKSMLDYLENKVYKNIPSEGFYQQFNTSTR